MAKFQNSHYPNENLYVHLFLLIPEFLRLQLNFKTTIKIWHVTVKTQSLVQVKVNNQSLRRTITWPNMASEM